MYCDYYGFREKPFTITPNPRFLFPSRNHREALAHLRYGVANRAGFTLLTGEVGTGKTTVLRTFLGELDQTGCRVALIFNPCQTAQELLQEILREYGIACTDTGLAGMLDRLNRFLLEENAAGHTVVLVIDEAQNLPVAVLEQIRLISNLETESDKLLQIIITGQPELEPLLLSTQLRQLNQRISVRYHLLPLDLADTRQYVVHRLVTAGCTSNRLFSDGALQTVYRASGGIPRLINLVCDRALLVGFADDCPSITVRVALKAARETFGRSLLVRMRVPVVAVGTCCLAAVLATAYLRRPHGAPLPTAATPPAAAPAVAATKRQAAKRVSVAVTVPASPVTPVRLAQPVLPAPSVTPVPAVPAQPVPTPAEQSRQAAQAFNALAQAWNVAFVPETGTVVTPASLGRLARKRRLELTRFSGSLDQLLHLDTPALLELRGTRAGSSRIVALAGYHGGRAVLAPTAGSAPLALPELKRLWTGRAYLLWKNYQDIPLSPGNGGGAVAVIRLQLLLAGTGHFTGEPTGLLDDQTRAALREFQSSAGLKADGVLNARTLLLLYRRSGKYPVPRLGAGERGHS